MNILAIDLGLKTGYRTQTVCSTVNCNTRPNESAGLKLIKFRKFLRDIIELESIDLIAYEQPGGRNFRGINSHSQFQGILHMVCMDFDIPYKGYSATEIKKFATGKGNANKQMMIDAAIAILDMPTTITDDEADAAWVYELGKYDFD